ncbi:MAG: acyl-CoA--6-aminopenicillanic acid acyltransferase, partial [Pyramidobacter sp.]|nr:acyl-CoA--6-aminopenicillanic acid acyltransferase [Pyramidobacter sp.]
LSEPAQLIRNGMNSHGLSLNCATLLSTLDRRGVCVPTNFMRRRLLQCRTFDEAAALVRSFKANVSLNYVLTGREGRALAFETNPGGHFEIWPTRGIITKGNDFVCDPSIDRFVPASKDMPRHFRGQRLGELFKKRVGAIDVPYVKECLRDHYGYPGSVCTHLTERGLITIASMIYVLDEGYAWMSWGNPCENEYEVYKL